MLVVDDEGNQRSALSQMINLWGYATATAAHGREALQKLADFPADVIITDLNMPVMDGKQFLEELQKEPGAPPAIMLTAFGNIETAIETIHDLGAFWFIEKPVQPKALKLIVERAIAQRKLTAHTERLERQLSSQGILGDMVGESSAMREVFSVLEQAAPSKATILITGETGTGKEVAARAIHELSPRRAGPFLAINCAALPESLIESELFGHEKGAFTGALEKRAGCFELAQGGTLLLDEIGEMPLSTQAKLLRVLEDRKVRRLGSAREVELDVRVLASTNKDLKEAAQKGDFREDLYFRLNVFEVHLPPLRSRQNDLFLIAESLIRGLNKKHECKVTDLAPSVKDLFIRHDWPGNVRELRNILERAVILAGEGTIQTSHLPSGFAGQPITVTEDGQGPVLRPGMTVEEAERTLIFLTLDHTGNNRTRAAEILGISTKTLFNKLKLYGVRAEGDEE